MGAYDNVELPEPKRSATLNTCQQLLDQWGIVMPRVEPLVLHFGLDDFEHTGLTEYWVANEAHAGYCGKFLILLDGQRCPCHKHAIKHETFFIVRGRVEMTANDRTEIMHPGDTKVMHPGVRHTFIAAEPSLILEVSMPSILNDNFFDDTRIGQHGVV